MDDEPNMITSHDQEREIYRILRFSNSPDAIARLPAHIWARALVSAKLYSAAEIEDDMKETKFEAMRNKFEELLRDGLIAACIPNPNNE
jgi:hypothetical protein